jgi:hypothetical protein
VADQRRYRYLAVDVLTREVVNPDVPIGDVEWGPDLNGTGTFTGTIEPRLIGVDPDQLQPVRTGILVHRAGHLRMAARLWTAVPDGPAYKLDGAGWSSGLFRRYDLAGNAGDAGPWTYADPLDVVRDLVGHIQSLPDGDLGIDVDATTSTATVGTPEEPYATPWWEQQNVGDVLAELADAEDGFDWSDGCAWSGDETSNEFTTRLRLGYPRLGRRRNDLEFTTGVNIRGVVPVEYDGDSYAQCVTGLGAGEGRNMRRADYHRRNGWPRTEWIEDLKSVKDQTVLDRLTAAEQQARSRMGVVHEVLLDPEHPAAPLGSFDVGDDVLCDIHDEWVDLTSWHRILSYRVKPDDADQVTVSLARSDAFTYGPG